jgi:hypothetical protein
MPHKSGVGEPAERATQAAAVAIFSLREWAQTLVAFTVMLLTQPDLLASMRVAARQ